MALQGFGLTSILFTCFVCLLLVNYLGSLIDFDVWLWGSMVCRLDIVKLVEFGIQDLDWLELDPFIFESPVQSLVKVNS